MSAKGGKGLSATVPASSRKMVQSLKEIVSNFPDHEIYAMLKDCNMDPNEAVSRLLSQDPFHEVKSKREKKKENKDLPDSRSRGINNSSIRGGSRVGTDRHGGRGGTNQFSSSDSGLQGKPVYKKENGTPTNGGFTSSASSVLGCNVKRRPQSYSDSVATENKISTSGIGNGLSSQHGGLQSAWMGNAGQISMADIVKMGKPQAKASLHNSYIHSGNHQNILTPSAASDHNFHSLQGHVSNVLETNPDQGYCISHNVPQNDEWPCIENQHDVNVSSVVDAHANSEYFGEADWQQTAHLDEHVVDHGSIANEDNVESASVSAKSTIEDSTGAEDVVSSVAANLEQLNLQRDDQGTQSEDNPSVVIPNHLQVHTPECLNLSFGSFGSANNASVSGSGPYTSMPLKSNLEDASGTTEVSTIGSSETRNSEYYGDEHLPTTSDGNLVHRTAVNAGTYDHSSVPQEEALKPESHETVQENEYSFPSSSHGFTYESTQQSEVTFSHSQTTSSQMHNLAPFSSVMQAYTNSLPNALLASTVQTAGEDIPYSPFPATQSMPAKYSNIASSIGSPTISLSEALRGSNITTPQPNPQTLPGGSVASGPGLPQHLAMHPYSQPTLPLGHFANMISYPFLPQSYTYMPSGFQQAFAGNSTYNQSLAAVLPQYKNSVSVSSLPQSAAIPSGYGFGSSTSIPGGNFPLNQPAAPTGATIAYDDLINSQFKDNNHMISLQQNDNSAMWMNGPGSRTISAVPPSTYYNFQGQSQQPGGFRQRQQQQQPSQHFGPPGYPNFYQSQTGMSLEHQQQNSREASFVGSHSQSQASKQSQQIWQNSY